MVLVRYILLRLRCGLPLVTRCVPRNCWIIPRTVLHALLVVPLLRFAYTPSPVQTRRSTVTAHVYTIPCHCSYAYLRPPHGLPPTPAFCAGLTRLRSTAFHHDRVTGALRLPPYITPLRFDYIPPPHLLFTLLRVHCVRYMPHNILFADTLPGPYLP